MSSINQHIQVFIQAVCQELRFKSIHEEIGRELAEHIEDQKNQYLKQGLDEETAVLQAVEQMGDPVLVGKQLNKAHRPRTEWSILAIVAVLVLLGGAVQYFLTGVNANSGYMFPRFLVYAPLGITVFMLTYFIDYTWLERYSMHAFFFLFAIMGIGSTVFRQIGVYRNVHIVILLFIPMFAGIIMSLKNKGYLGVMVSGIFYAAVAGLCLLAPSFYSLLLLSVCSLIIVTVAINKGYFGSNRYISLALVYVPGLLGLPFLLLMASPLHLRKFYTLFNPELDLTGYGWLPAQVRLLFSSSRFLGGAVLDGNLNQMRIDQLLPEWATDFSLTYLIARLGYVAGLVITVLMLILIIRMFVAVLQQKHDFGFLVSFSACLAITGQIVLYVLSNTGVLVVYGGTLPFISFGGIGFIINMALVGLVLSVYRRTDLVSSRMSNIIYDRKFITLKEGKLIIDLGLSLDK